MSNKTVQNEERPAHTVLNEAIRQASFLACKIGIRDMNCVQCGVEFNSLL